MMSTGLFCSSIAWKGSNPPPVINPRPIPFLTSPGIPGAFLFPSSAPFNGPAFAPPGLPRAAALPAALPLCPVRPLPPRLGQARPPRRPCRPSAALSLCRFPCPVPPVSRAALVKPRPARLPACLAPPRPLAAAGRSNPLRRPPCRPPRRPGRAATAAGRPPGRLPRRRRRKEGRFTNQR